MLCGQPEQNQGARSPVSIFSVASDFSLAAITASRASMRAAVSLPSGARPIFFSRFAIAFAMIAGVRSAFARSSQFSLGFGTDHSPFDASSANLPTTFGRTSGRQL